MEKESWAHTAPTSGGTVQLLADHLETVRDMAEEFAKPLQIGREAAMAGLLHDFGKYGELFQRRLRHPNQISGVDHWSAGAWYAAINGKSLGAALAIQGHHIGLQELSKPAIGGMDPAGLRHRHPLGLSLSTTEPDVLETAFSADGLSIDPLADSRSVVTRIRKDTAIETMLDVRMLFSCLADADYLDTEAHFNQDPITKRKRFRRSAPELQATTALSKLLGLIELRRENMPDSSLKDVRQIVLEDCLKASTERPGLFTLTAPTGSGKTLAMLAFALKHAMQWNKRRIIVVLPFLSIIEQTAQIYRNVLANFGENFVVEHHSMATGLEPKADDDQDPHSQARLFSENWDAPVIITSTVQFLESLFTNRPGRARKLHNIANSVVLMDEVQTLPLPLMTPTLASLAYLSQRYHSSILMATATQPAFKLFETTLKEVSQQEWDPHEVIIDPPGLFARVSRYRVETRYNAQSWDSIADDLVTVPQSLVVVNLKRHAQELGSRLMGRLPDNDVYHLSTNMCPKHRTNVLRQIKDLLALKMPCRLVATQCVEAGVDIDFPVVFRAWGPMDSLAQVAGRCNREGSMPEGGRFVIFTPQDEAYPGGIYRTASIIAKDLARNGLDLENPSTYEKYWRSLYEMTQTDKAWLDILARHNFVDVATKYRLIDSVAIEILVPYEPDVFEHLANEVMTRGLTQSWIRRARPYSVSLYRPKPLDPIWGFLEPVGGARHAAEWFICRSDTLYDGNYGLNSDHTERYWIA